jgi:5-methylcytosine-specific restriction endonuclease McrA
MAAWRTMTDIGTTLRKPLTPTQRLKLFESERGICCICGLKIVGKFIDEHKRALGLGGGNEMDNRGVAHPKCADIKTQTEDMPRIVKAKAQKRAAHGIKSEGPKIQNREPVKVEKPSKIAKGGKIEKTYGLRWNPLTGERMQ